ncbi:polysaccharide biosynthesis/export family protein [Zavarzinella formosa]|uniref:polysaccharide biosynthesis/export family protein n=1 Tax=Zavarzinella formosa TaxID=360055 RepID=UPI000306B6C6|nr:polysaccharide biosynthesis/export family protein [Zavarzinella formosa]
MYATHQRAARFGVFAVAGWCLLNAGCLTPSVHPGVPPAPYVHPANKPVETAFADPRYEQTLPRELQKVSMPEYVIEPPDILRIELLRVAPTANYKVETQDGLFVQITYPAQTEPFAIEALVGPDGQINLGTTFGGVIKVSGMTVPEIRDAIEKQAIAANVKSPKAQVSLLMSRSLSQIRGEYLVRPDGTVGLGTYGGVRLVGQTLTQAKATIEEFLGKKLIAPEVSVDVAAYNSKIFYVIYDGGGRGQQVARLPITGNETVLDAVSQLFGLSPVSSQHHIWLARPTPAANCQELILPVDWIGITRSANTSTNYQLMPGDRIYVKANPLIETDNWMAMILSPVERLLGVTLLGQTTVQALNHPNSVGGSR